MQHSLSPPPPPPPPGAGLGDVVLDWVGRIVLYPLRRPLTDLPQPPAKGILVGLWRAVLMALEVRILIALGQDALISFAAAHHRPTDPPLMPVGPLHAPLATWEVAALVGAFALLVVLDRQKSTWPVHLTWRPPFLEFGRRARALVLPPVKPNVLVLGRPYDRAWDDLHNRMVETALWHEVYAVNQAELCTHATVVAPTRAGKTYNVTIPLIEFSDRIEGAGIFIDAKGDDLTGPTFDAEYPGAFHRRFNLLDHEHSFRLQVWIGRTVRERAERLAACLVPEGTTEQARYFTHNGRAAFVNLVLAHHQIFHREPSFAQLLKYLRNAGRRKKLIERLPARSPIIDAITRIDDLRETQHDVLGGLDAIIDPLAHPEVTRFFAASGQGYTIEQLLQAKARACFTLPTGPNPVLAPILGRIVIGQFTQAVLDPANNTEYLKLLVVEDAANFVTPLLGLAMAQASSHNAAYVLIFQDLSQIRDEALIQDVLTNSGLKIVLGGIGEADSTRFSKLFGAHERLFRSQNANSGRGRGHSQSSGHSHNSGSSHRGDNETQQHSVGWGLIPRSRPDFTPTELRQLRDHHAVVERRDNRGHLTPATMIHFDAALTRTLTERQRRELLGPYAEPLNHLQPLLPLDHPSPKALITPLPADDAPGAPEPDADVDLPTPAPATPGSPGGEDTISMSSGLVVVDSTCVEVSSASPGGSDAAPLAPEEAPPAATARDEDSHPLPEPVPVPPAPILSGLGVGADRSRQRPAARRTRVPMAPLPTQAPLPLSGTLDSSAPPKSDADQATSAVPVPVVPAAPGKGSTPLPVPVLAQDLVDQFGFTPNDAIFLVRKAAQSGYDEAGFRALIAPLIAAGDVAAARAGLYVRLTVNAPLLDLDSSDTAD